MKTQDNLDVLHSIFFFKHLPCSAEQNVTTTKECFRLFSLCYQSIKGSLAWSKEDRCSLGEAFEFPLSSIQWFTEYGCAMIRSTQVGCFSEPHCFLELVALDQWRFFVHSHRAGRDFVAESEGEATIFSGVVAESQYGKILQAFELEKYKQAQSTVGRT